MFEVFVGDIPIPLGDHEDQLLWDVLVLHILQVGGREQDAKVIVVWACDGGIVSGMV